MSRFWFIGKAIVVSILLMPFLAAAQTPVSGDLANTVREVQQYNFAIHILAMLLVGFGFLMVFVKRYGYGATTGTYILVAVGLPLYLCTLACVPQGCFRPKPLEFIQCAGYCSPSLP
jgi:ammonium transporter Rh